MMTSYQAKMNFALNCPKSLFMLQVQSYNRINYKYRWLPHIKAGI